MADELKTVFVSYRRRVSSWFAHMVFRELRAHDYNVFMDVESIDGGSFPDVILHQIEARAHFLLLLEPGAFARVATAGDWLRREIEHALDTRRNIVPLLGRSFTFELDEFRSTLEGLPAKFAALANFQGVNFPEDYVDAAFTKLRERALRVRPGGPVKSAPAAERVTVQHMMESAAAAQPDSSSGGWAFNSSPELTLNKALLGWSGGIGFDEYELERADNGEFKGTIAYEGKETSWVVPPDRRDEWFRVRTKWLLSRPGAWSTPVFVPSRARSLLETMGSAAPETPHLSGVDESGYDPLNALSTRHWRSRVLPVDDAAACVLSWGTSTGDEQLWSLPRPRISGLFGSSRMAVLEKSGSVHFGSRAIYMGCKTSFRDTDPYLRTAYYRVKVIDVMNRASDWSNVFERKGSFA